MDNPRRSPHGDLIATAAKAHLSPIGVKRKGKSRLWLKDNGWWLAVVEFQPSAWSKGTYLNVAAMWLWHAKDHISFDEHKRVGGFAEFTDPESFALAADQYSSRAAVEVVSLLHRFATLDRVAMHLRAEEDGNPWRHYHAMMASLANGELDLAQGQCETLSRIKHDVAWCLELKAKAAEITAQAKDAAIARTLVTSEIAAARTLLKLPPVGEASLWRSQQDPTPRSS